MVIDTSAAVAIIMGEPDRAALVRAIENDSIRLMSAGSMIELGIVLESRMGGRSRGEIDRFESLTNVDIRPVDHEQVALAWEGFRKFGRGRHPAGLNFGDCFSYALSISTSEPLLFKGGDYALTDVEAVPLQP